ncbi:hypothetical protein KY321_05030, partial [Candidatus Woesearchaeota archaeon]|nr:hypothetical protein [Candidatus Woesearchaeota archaeon]
GDIDIKVTSLDGTSKKITKELNIGKCINIQAEAKLTLQNSCPCEEKDFEFKVKNIGNFHETYTFKSSKLNEYFTFMPENIILKPGEEIKVVATLDAPCSISGDFDFEFIARSKNNEQKIELPARIMINECYDYSVTSGKIQNLFNAQTQPYKVCKDISYNIPIMIENKENFNNKYELDVKSKYAKLSHEEVIVKAQDSKIIALNFNSDDVINTSVYLTTESVLGEKVNKIRLPFIVEDCYNLDIVSKKNVHVEDNVAKIKLLNKGTKDINADVIIKGNKHSFLDTNNIKISDKNILEIKTTDLKTGIDRVNVKFRLDNDEIVSKSFVLIFGTPILYLYRYYFLLSAILLGILIYIFIVKMKKDSKNFNKKRIKTDKLIAKIESQIPKEEKKKTKKVIKKEIKLVAKKEIKKENKKDTKKTKKSENSSESKMKLFWIVLGIIILFTIMTIAMVLAIKYPSLIGMENCTFFDFFNNTSNFFLNNSNLNNITQNISNASINITS